MRTTYCLGFICLVSLCTASAALGQETVPRVSLRETAARLARSGAENNDARTLLAAAQLLITAERASPGLRRVPSPQDSARATKEPTWSTPTPAYYLRWASAIAVEQQDQATARLAAVLASDSTLGIGDEELADELKQAADEISTTRGAQGGPFWVDGLLAAGSKDEFRLGFQGGRVLNRITVTASSAQGDLNCYVYQGERILDSDVRDEPHCSIEWSNQLQSATLKLEIRNKGADTYYVLTSN